MPTRMMPLSPNDSLWLNMDTPNNLMVIESIMWFDDRLDPEAVREAVRTRLLDRYPVFTWRPETSSGAVTRDYWVADDDFDLDRHVTVHELGGAGGRAELQGFLEEQMSVPLPKDRPLWRAHILQGDAFGALMIRFHHAIADGTALARVLIEMTTPSPEGSADREPGMHPVEPMGPSEPTPDQQSPRRKRDRALQAANQVVTLPLAAGVKLTSTAASLVHLIDPDEKGGTASGLATTTISTADIVDKLLVSTPPDLLLFGRIGLTKRADWAPPQDLEEVKAAARTRGATVNDLMLAAVAGGLRRYLATRGQEGRDLIAMIPVNLRPMDEPLPAHLGNRFALVALELPLGAATTPERLDVAKRRMDLVKAGPEAVVVFGATHAVGAVGAVSGRASRALVDYLGGKAVGIITNVPGPREARYFAGQELVGILGWVPAAGTQSLGVCIFSYNGQIRVGFKTDATVVPDVANLVAAYVEEMDELLALAGD